MPTRKYWGWGYEGIEADADVVAFAEAALAERLGWNRRAPAVPVPAASLSLRAPRVALPAALAHLGRPDAHARASHAYGKSYRDLVRAMGASFPSPPDIVALPESEDDVVRLLDFAAGERVAVTPYGGGSSVCGGVETLGGDGLRGTLSMDLTRLDRVVRIDATSHAAQIQGGALGPVLEDQLRASGLTLRHYPQSFEHSTLGGWIATRAGGHFATLWTHVDELVESVRVVTPSGILATRRLPGSGAGPSPERLFCGSEGTMGIIVEAWMRVVRRPIFRASATATFSTFAGGLAALRVLSQSKLHPANARLLDPTEALLAGAGAGDVAVLVVGFESADHPVAAALDRALEIVRDAGGTPGSPKVRGPGDGARGDDAEGKWRAAFLRGPYLRDALVARGIFVETYETATTWDRIPAIGAAVERAARAALGSSGARAIVACRVTHAYPDGCAPYWTVIAEAPDDADAAERVRRRVAQHDEVKAAVTDAILESGGTSTHHHAVGRDVAPFWAKECDPLFDRALRAVKRELDPAGILNPGVLFQP
jgi:alkyldihydroxyacetonephosphate synthase